MGNDSAAMVRTYQSYRRVGSQFSQFTFNVLSAAAGACFSSKKISQPSDFGYLFCGQHGRNKLRLRSSMYLVQMTLAGRLR